MVLFNFIVFLFRSDKLLALSCKRLSAYRLQLNEMIILLTFMTEVNSPGIDIIILFYLDIQTPRH